MAIVHDGLMPERYVRSSRLHFAFGLQRAHGLAERMHGLLDLRTAVRRRDEAAGRAHDVDAVAHQAHADLAGERARDARALRAWRSRSFSGSKVAGSIALAGRVGIDQEGRGLAVDAPRHALLHQHLGAAPRAARPPSCWPSRARSSSRNSVSAVTAGGGRQRIGVVGAGMGDLLPLLAAVAA